MFSFAVKYSCCKHLYSLSTSLSIFQNGTKSWPGWVGHYVLVGFDGLVGLGSLFWLGSMGWLGWALCFGWVGWAGWVGKLSPVRWSGWVGLGSQKSHVCNRDRHTMAREHTVRTLFLFPCTRFFFLFSLSLSLMLTTHSLTQTQNICIYIVCIR